MNTTTDPIRILLVEDSSDDALLLLHALRPLGAVQSQRVDDVDALDKALRAGVWNIAICDHNVPGLDAPHSLRRIQEYDPDLPIVVVSGDHGEEIAVSMMRAGARDYLVKDSLARLPEVIKRVVAEAAAKRRQRAAERELEQSRELLQMAVEGARVVIWHWFLAENKLQFTPRLEDMFGVEPLPELASIDAAFASIHPEDRPVVESQFSRCVSGEVDELEAVYRLQTGSGETQWVETRGRLFRDEAGTPSRLSGTIVDITNRRQLEEQLIHSQRSEAIGRLAGGIAHDFNNLLTVVLSYCQLLETRRLDATAADDVSCIRAAAERAASLTSQLLVFSRRQVTRVLSVDVNDVCRGIEPLLGRLIGEDVTIVWELDDVQTIRADPTHAEQVVTNLVVNARDAMPEGGRVLIGTRSRLGAEVPFACEEASRWVELCVADEGTGMDARVAESAFEAFFTTKADGKGTGLGLATCRMVVEQVGGHVAIESTLGEGTRVYAWWPAEQDQEAEAFPRQRSSVRRMPGTGRILLVEDESLVRGMAAMALRDLGYTLSAAEDAEEALAGLEGNVSPPDLLITDVVLPGMSGPQLVATLRARWPSLPVIFTSGYASETVMERGLDADDVNFLPKPYTPSKLAAMVVQVFRS